MDKEYKQKYFSIGKCNQPANTSEKKGHSANVKFPKRLSREETFLSEIRKLTSLSLSTH